jgi:hypothetical protein
MIDYKSYQNGKDISMFAKLSAEKALDDKILLEHRFITEYMPFAPDTCVKVYLYGLFLCNSGMDSSVEMMVAGIGIPESEILSAYKYWEDQGLVSFISISPPHVEYLPVLPISKRIKTYSKAKYKSFNDQLHAMLPNRTILPNEYNEYYNAIETFHIEKEAMLAIIAYCVRLKDENISYQYILTVARNLAAEGYYTFERVNERLNELDLYDGEIRAVLKALSAKRSPDVSDKKLLLKWTKSLGYGMETIIKVAKTIKKGGVDKLDSTLGKYYENHLFTFEDIEKFNKERERIFALTAKIVKILGRYYERLDYITEAYTSKWLGYGFEDEALVLIAEHAFKSNIKELEDLDGLVEAYYQKGMLCSTDIQSMQQETKKSDQRIRKILLCADIDRPVNSWDRDYYRTWTFSWNMPDDLICFAAEKGRGKGLAYINGILASFLRSNIKTVDEAKKAGIKTVENPSPVKVTTKTPEELLAMIDKVAPEDI